MRDIDHITDRQTNKYLHCGGTHGSFDEVILNNGVLIRWHFPVTLTS